MELDKDVDEWNGVQALHVLGDELDEDRQSHERSLIGCGLNVQREIVCWVNSPFNKTIL
jgi:hypothetical protein